MVKVGDKIKVIKLDGTGGRFGVGNLRVGDVYTVSDIYEDGVIIGDDAWWFDPSDVEVISTDGDVSIRKYETGATRDTDQGKLDYVKALSPIVLRRYVEYLGKHREQSDGSMRDWDNWKNGIPKDVYLSSLGRHFVDLWLLSEGYEASDNHGPVTDVEDVLCAIIFNTSGMLHEILDEYLTKEKAYDEAMEHEINGA